MSRGGSAAQEPVLDAARTAGSGSAEQRQPDVDESPTPGLRLITTPEETGTVSDVVTPTLLTVAEIAQRLGVKPATVRAYHQRAEQRRRRGVTPLPGDFPPPDHRYGLTPVWKASTIRDWQRRRPGRGAGGGRPRKERS